MTDQLFREEVLATRRHSWLGGISLAQPLALWALALAAGLAAVAVGLFLATGTYTRRAHVAGELVPDLGLSTVVAPSDGVVARLDVHEGERVLAGGTLALISIPRTTANGAGATEAIASGLERRRESLNSSDASQAALSAARVAGTKAQLDAARRELEQAVEQAGSHRRQVALARETLERYQALERDHYLSTLQLRQQEQALLEQINVQQQLERQVTALSRQRAQLEQVLLELPIERSSQAAAAMRELTLLDREEVQNQISTELLVQAPVSGLLTTILVTPGQAVRVGQPLLSMLPAGSRLRAQLLVSSRAIGFVRAGDRVLLRYAAYPYQKFGHHGGVVVAISRSALGGAQLAGISENGQQSEPYYRIFVDLDRQSIVAYGRDESLRPGMLVDADIMGEHRKLYEWALEPLYSLTGKL